MYFGVVIGVVLGFLVFVVARCFFTVEEGHRAAVTRFGKVRTEGGRMKLYPPGAHFKWPWDHVRGFSVMDKIIDLGKGIKGVDDSSGFVAMTADGTQVRVESKVRFKIDPENAYPFLFEIKTPIRHVKGMFTSILRSEIANVAAEPSMRLQNGHDVVKQVMETAGGAYVRLRRQRVELNRKIGDHILARMGEEYGIKFLGIDLTEVIPPEELASALNAVQNARAEISAQYARVEAECQQRLTSAERNVAIAETRARAVETEILTMCGALEQLELSGSLNSYLQRRRDEVSGEAKLSYIRGGNA